jgi:hypothetical protein
VVVVVVLAAGARGGRTHKLARAAAHRAGQTRMWRQGTAATCRRSEPSAVQDEGDGEGVGRQ